MIAIVDYGCGNIQSLENAFRKIGQETTLASTAKEIAEAKRIVLPGVGSFGQAMEKIRENGIEQALKRAALEKPFLGICLGMQILFEESEESKGEGLCRLKGSVKRFTVAKKVPQMGWNQVIPLSSRGLFEGIGEEWFFFANSFFAVPEKEAIAAESFYGKRFCAAVQKGNLAATQFHPEKSGNAGLKILRNFAKTEVK